MKYITDISTVYYIMSESCNLECSFCCLSNPKNTLSMSSEAFVKLFNSIKYDIGDCEISMNFSGGEPTLQVEKILDIIKSIRNNNISFGLYTNLTYEISDKIEELFSFCTIYTSWDPIQLRFKTKKNFDLWKENCTQIQPECVNTILTEDLLLFDPYKLFEDYLSWNVKQVSFELLQVTGNACISKMKMPRYISVDKWLCKAYDVQIPELQIVLIENIKEACTDTRNNKHNTVVMITTDGSVSIECDTFEHGYNHIHSCNFCSYYKYCRGVFFQTKTKYAGLCQFPKKLFKKIAQDYNPHILSVLGV